MTKPLRGNRDITGTLAVSGAITTGGTTVSTLTLGATGVTAAPGSLGFSAVGDIVYLSGFGRAVLPVGNEGQYLRAVPDSVSGNPVQYRGGEADGMIEAMRPASAVAETFPRAWGVLTNNAILSTGRLQLVGIYLQKGWIVSSISFMSGTTAGASLTHCLFGVYDTSRARLATSADDTTASWSANTYRTLSMTSAYTATATGLYYLGIMVAGTTVPTLMTCQQALNETNISPVLNGTSSTGLSTSIPNPAAAITAAAHIVKAYCT